MNMNWKKKTLLFCAVLGCTLSAQELQELTFTTAVPAEKAPVIDGKLDDPCWKKAVVQSTYYEFNKPNPNRSPLKTDCRVVYDAKGIYVGIRNWEQDPKSIRHDYYKNHDGNMWRDDCAEIYFDPAASGIGFYKFVVNANGKYDDSWRWDRANFYADWNGEGVLAGASIQSKSWDLELFVPWSDLKKQPKAGDLWTFLHCRFKMGGTKQIYSTSSPMGSYATPEKYGYLYFSDGGTPDMKMIGKVISGKKNDNWVVDFGDKLLLNDDRAGISVSTLKVKKAEADQAYKVLLAKVEALAGKYANKKEQAQLAKLKTQYVDAQKAYDGTLPALKNVMMQKIPLENLYWDLRRTQLADAAAVIEKVNLPKEKHPAKPEKYDGYNGWFRHNYSLAYKTPHWNWGGKPENQSEILYVTVGLEDHVREGLELMQRYGFNMRVFGAMSNRELGRSSVFEDAVRGGQKVEKERAFTACLQDDPDIFIFQNFQFPALRKDFAVEIMRRVRDEGKGLVLINAGGNLPELKKLKEDVVLRDAILKQAPLLSTPEMFRPKGNSSANIQRFVPSSGKFLKVYHFGKGTVIVTSAKMPRYTLLWKGFFENYNVFMANVMQAASGKMPQAVIDCGKISAGTLPVTVTYTKDRCFLFGSSYKALTRIRTLDNQLVFETEQKLAKGKNELQIPLADVAPGSYYLDIVAFRDGKEEASAFLPFEKTSPVGNITLKTPEYAMDLAPFTAQASFTGELPENGSVEFTLEDLPYRQVWMKKNCILKKGSTTAFVKFENYPKMTLAGVVRAKVRNAAGKEIGSAWSLVRFPTHDFPFYPSVGWNSATDELFLPQITDNGFWNSSTSSDHNINSLMNVWSMPHLVQVKLSPSDKGGTRFNESWMLPKKSAEKAYWKKVIDGDYNPNRPEVKKMMEVRLAPLVQDCLKCGVVAYNLGDENGFSLEIGYGPSDQKFFPEFLEKKYGTIANYNRISGKHYASFADVPRVKPGKAVENHDYQSWYDQVQYAEKLYADAHRVWNNIIKRLDPRARVGAEGSKNGDLEETIQGLEFWGPYNNLVNDEVLRCLAGDRLRGHWWGGYFGSYRDGYPHDPWKQLLSGNVNSDLFFILLPGGSMSAHSADYTFAPYVEKMLPYLHELRDGVAVQLIHTPMTAGKTVMLYSHQSNRASELEERMAKPEEGQSAFIKYCYRTGLPIDFITKKSLAKLSQYDVLLLFGATSLTDDEIAAVKSFVKKGGLVIADINPAMLNSYFIPYRSNPLKELFGDITLVNASGYENVPVKLNGFEFNKVRVVKGAKLVEERNYGKGKAILLNFAIATAKNTEKVPGSFDLWMSSLLGKIKPEFTLRGTDPDSSVLRIRQGEGFRLAGFHVNPKNLGGKVTLAAADGKARYIYEVNHGFLCKSDKVEIASLKVPFKLYSFFDKEQTAPGIALSAKEVNRGEAVSFKTASLRRNSVYSLKLTAPDGKMIPNRSREFIADGKTAEVKIPFALNDQPGVWKLTLKDIATGLCTVKECNLR